MTVRVVARRPNGNLLAFTIEGAEKMTVQAFSRAVGHLFAVVPTDAVWMCEPWTSARPR